MDMAYRKKKYVCHRGISKKTMLRLMSGSTLFMYSSRNFLVSVVTFKSLIYSEFIFACGIRKWSSLNISSVEVLFSQPHLSKRPSFLHFTSLPPLS